jgi:hypothetical protein
MRFLSLRRLLEFEAHSPWVCLTQYVPLTGFLNLSAIYFFKSIPALFHAGSAHGILPFRAFSFQAAVTSLNTTFPPDVTIIPQVNLKNLLAIEPITWNQSVSLDAFVLISSDS